MVLRSRAAPAAPQKKKINAKKINFKFTNQAVQEQFECHISYQPEH